VRALNEEKKYSWGVTSVTTQAAAGPSDNCFGSKAKEETQVSSF
jgi:hypothetical protein